MLNQNAYCINCGESRHYTISTSREETTVRGIIFNYIEQEAHCDVCGEEIYVPEINDENVEFRENAYRKVSGLITIPEVKEIMEKYNIGAGPLAKLLGFGEVTINRYLSGQLPSKESSERLLEVRASHVIMEEYLERGKDAIATVAYQKCRKEIDKLKELYGDRKIELVARYILCKSIDITPLALQKLLYYAQAFFHGIYNEDLFTDNCQAWAYGPVFPDVYYRYREYGYNPIEKPTTEFGSNLGELTTKEIAFLDAIVDAFGTLSGSALSIITHAEKPWLEARGSLQPSDRSVTVINRDTINEYFNSVVAQLSIENPFEIKKYAQKMCHELV